MNRQQAPLGRYTLKGRVAVPCDETDIAEWGRFMIDEKNRVVAKDDIGDVLVSTVFLGIDHSFIGNGPPILFETMVFRGKESLGYQERYATWDEAVAGHAQAFAWVMGGMKDSDIQ